MVLAYFGIVVGCRVMVALMMGALVFQMRMSHMRTDRIDAGWQREAVEVLITIAVAAPILRALP